MTIKDLIKVINPTTQHGDLTIRLRVSKCDVMTINTKESTQLFTLPSVANLNITRITVEDDSLILDITDLNFPH